MYTRDDDLVLVDEYEEGREVDTATAVRATDRADTFSGWLKRPGGGYVTDLVYSRALASVRGDFDDDSPNRVWDSLCESATLYDRNGDPA